MHIHQAHWVNLFDGKTLDGWRQTGGKARYEVKDGELQGITVHGTPNSFLMTEKCYSDFILELDFKIDTGINSGVQVRSHTYPEYKNGQMYGYQIDIDPSPRRWSGGIYDESRRFWLAPLKENPAAMEAFRQFQWNHYRIEAIGGHIRTWINDVPAAEILDDYELSGHIALQVHNTYGDSTKANRYTRWRNVRLLEWGAPVWTADTEAPQSNRITHARDKDANTFWRGKWLMIDFQKPMKNRHFSLQLLPDGSGKTSFQVETSLDGKKWRVQEKHENVACNSEFQVLVKKKTRFVRVSALGAEGLLRVGEWRI